MYWQFYGERPNKGKADSLRTEVIGDQAATEAQPTGDVSIGLLLVGVLVFGVLV